MVTKTKPDKACYCCKSTEFWFNGISWNCAKCHPSPNTIPDEHKLIVIDASNVGPGQTAKIQVIDTGSRIEILRARVAAGNQKLINAFVQIKASLNDADYDAKMAEFRRAQHKLDALCDELRILGYNDCLYIVEGVRDIRCNSWPDDQCCWVCPCDELFWENVICGRGSNKISESVKHKHDLVEFLATLGGLI
ncbi:MAG: hypothetical protein PHX07_02085 [Candidatus Marinimicrobia bacterium]|nr:hypothetical protein [Candidatus Neomarinimicrobiota bacterium]